MIEAPVCGYIIRKEMTSKKTALPFQEMKRIWSLTCKCLSSVIPLPPTSFFMLFDSSRRCFNLSRSSVIIDSCDEEREHLVKSLDDNSDTYNPAVNITNKKSRARRNHRLIRKIKLSCPQCLKTSLVLSLTVIFSLAQIVTLSLPSFNYAKALQNYLHGLHPLFTFLTTQTVKSYIKRKTKPAVQPTIN